MQGRGAINARLNTDFGGGLGLVCQRTMQNHDAPTLAMTNAVKISAKVALASSRNGISAAVKNGTNTMAASGKTRDFASGRLQWRHRIQLGIGDRIERVGHLGQRTRRPQQAARRL